VRIVLIDMMFSWPPHGGADVDAYHVAIGLQALGHQVKLVGCWSAGTWERGDFTPASLPFAAARVEFPHGIRSTADLDPLVRETDAFRPDVVLVGDSFFLKPALILRLATYPIVARFYAHEIICQKDILRYRDGAPCRNSFPDTPDLCRACGAQHQRAWIQSGHPLAWTEEYLAAGAYAPEYHTLTMNALKELSAAIVYNAMMRDLLAPHVREVAVVPGAVDPELFPFAPPPEPAGKQSILMVGRGEDPAKGADVLLAAGEILALERSDFTVRITLPETTPGSAWFEALPWCDHRATRDRYRDADICVVPSIWDEPFGMVALEAMATGRPVIVSDTGGLRDTIEHGVSGLRFERGNPRALADALRTLLDDAALRRALGKAARTRIEREFTWDIVVKQHIEPLLQHCAQAKR